jgi:c-di-GMP-binding flagellar brake protein YcgR
MGNDQERRAAPRHKVNLRFWVLITAVSNPTQNQEQYFFLRARTLDVSASGLALIVSAEDVREIQRLGSESVMRLLLPLPGEAVELEAMPVRFVHMNSESDEVLVGAKIINISDRDRERFMKFIRECENS